PIAAICASAPHPELVPVALVPVGLGSGDAVLRLTAGRPIDPFGRYELPLPPPDALQQQLPAGPPRLSAHRQPEAAGIHARRTLLSRGRLESERLEQPWPQVVE